MKIYTKTGDKGMTQLVGKKVAKTHERVEAYGTVDELNSSAGLAVVFLEEEGLKEIAGDIQRIQHELFDLGGDLAKTGKQKDWALKEESVTKLETKIDQYWEEAPPLTKFILPGGGKAAAQLHVCRTVTRRAERLAVKAAEIDETVTPHAVIYLNRLSDYFFAAARAVNSRNGEDDVLYERGGDVFK